MQACLALHYVGRGHVLAIWVTCIPWMSLQLVPAPNPSLLIKACSIEAARVSPARMVNKLNGCLDNRATYSSVCQ
ncbi:unnamed protein product, partial [Ilex paraguariensis]